MNLKTVIVLIWAGLLWGTAFEPLLGGDSEPGRELSRYRQRIDYRDLGQWPSNLIEADESKITSLAVDTGSGIVYGATSGSRAHIFGFDPATNHVRPLGFLPVGSGVHNALALPGDGYLYIGTGKDMTAVAEISDDWGRELGHYHILKKMWMDIQAQYENYTGGHIYRFDPADWNAARYQADNEAKVADLGIPVPGEGVYCMTAGKEGKEIYGITYPGGIFFVFNIETGQTRTVGPTWEEVAFSGPRKGVRTLPGALILDIEGNCYFSRDEGWLGRYSPETGKIETLKARLPGEFYPIHNRNFDIYPPVVECWTKGRGGALYGGTNDGFLFKYLPGRESTLNLGKVRITRRIRALATALDGTVYGTAGEAHIGCTLFSYNPRSGGLSHHGPIEVDRSPYYAWNPLNFGAMATGLDGTIYLGEEERRGHLYILIPPSR